MPLSFISMCFFKLVMCIEKIIMCCEKDMLLKISNKDLPENISSMSEGIITNIPSLRKECNQIVQKTEIKNMCKNVNSLVNNYNMGFYEKIQEISLLKNKVYNNLSILCFHIIKRNFYRKKTSLNIIIDNFREVTNDLYNSKYNELFNNAFNEVHVSILSYFTFYNALHDEFLDLLSVSSNYITNNDENIKKIKNYIYFIKENIYYQQNKFKELEKIRNTCFFNVKKLVESYKMLENVKNKEILREKIKKCDFLLRNLTEKQVYIVKNIVVLCERKEDFKKLLNCCFKT